MDNPIVEFSKITIDDRSYDVTKGFAHAVEQVIKFGEQAARLQHPDLDPVVPVYLTDAGQKCIAVIKEYRMHTGETLKRAKDIVLSTRKGSRVLLGHYPLSQAKSIAEPFREAGATVRVPSPLILLAQQAGSEEEIEDDRTQAEHGTWGAIDSWHNEGGA